MKINLDDVDLEMVDKISDMLVDPVYSRDDVASVSVMLAARVLGYVRHEREMKKRLRVVS